MLYLLNNNSVKLTVLLLTCVFVFTACTGTIQPSENEAMLLDGLSGVKETSYQTAVIGYGSLSRRLSGEGAARYPERQSIVSNFMDATLISINVTNNSVVKEGDVIAEFEINYSRSELETLYSNLEISKKQYSVQEETYNLAVSTARTMLAEAENRLKNDDGSTDRNILTSAVKKAEIVLEKVILSLDFFLYQQGRDLSAQQAVIEAFETRITNNKLYAPFDGVITNISYLAAGKTVPPNTVICEVYSPDTVLLATNLEVSNGMRYNMDVSITATNHTSEYTGRIISAPNVRGESTGQVIISPNEKLGFDPGDRMKRISIITLRYELDNVLIVPAGAVNNEDGRRYVYLYEDGVVKKRYITCGLSDIENIQVLEGLDAGQTVIIY